MVLLLALLIFTVSLTAAPVPQPGPVKPKALTAKDLQGQWLMLWWGSLYCVTLSPEGDYYSINIKTGDPWWGSWWVQDGYLFIQEATQPELLDSYGNYGFKLYPETLHGELHWRGSQGQWRQLDYEEILHRRKARAIDFALTRLEPITAPREAPEDED